MTTIKTFSKKYPVLTYFALTFVISWGSILLVVGPGFSLDSTAIPQERLPFVYLAMLIGPSVAGILLTALVAGGAGLRQLLSRFVKWRVGGRWYAVALLTAPLVLMAVLLALTLFSRAFLPAIFTADDRASLLLTALAVGLMVGLLEELGWTGFAIPRLRLHYGVLATGLSVGLLWGAWHFLVFWESNTFSTAFGLALLLARLFSWLPPYRVFMVWVYDQTGSLLLAILIHATLVASLQILVPPALTGIAILTYILVWAGALWVVVAAIVVATGGYLWRKPFPKVMGVASR